MHAEQMSAAGAFALALFSSWAMGEMNVYDQPMTECGPSHASGCTYVAEDAGAHEVCVRQLPNGFSAETGQGDWSDSFTGQPWCICIWAYSNYILQKRDLSLKCESIPSKVLEGQYSLDKFEQCGLMSSTEGCGSEDIRRSIKSLCQQCDKQADDDDSKAALKGKCDKILASAPAGIPSSMEPQRLFSEDAPSVKIEVAHASMIGSSSLILGVLGLAIAGAASLIVIRQRRFCQNGQLATDESCDLLAEEG